MKGQGRLSGSGNSEPSLPLMNWVVAIMMAPHRGKSPNQEQHQNLLMSASRFTILPGSLRILSYLPHFRRKKESHGSSHLLFPLVQKQDLSSHSLWLICLATIDHQHMPKGWKITKSRLQKSFFKELDVMQIIASYEILSQSSSTVVAL